MESFINLFKKFIIFYYSCFDRIVINGYLSNLMTEQSIVYFFKNICKFSVIDKTVLSKRTNEYIKWVEATITKNNIPSKWAEKKERKEDTVKPYLEKVKRKNNFGVYFIFKSMEQNSTFRSSMPKYKTNDDTYRIIKKTRSRFTHLYFYIFDQQLGSICMRVAAYLPFNITFIINGHSFVERELIKNNITFKKNDNAFTSVSDVALLQSCADKLSPDIIKERLSYWAFAFGPKFSKKERQYMNLNYSYYIAQVEYCFNFIFKRNFTIRNLFQKACQTSLITFLSDKISYIFGTRITRRLKGKLSNSLESYNHAHHVFRLHLKNSFIKQYEKLSTFLRNEVTSNNIKEFGINKSLDNLPLVKNKFVTILDRFTSFQANIFNVHFEFDIFSELSKPIQIGKSKISGIKIQDYRVLRLMENILHSSAKIIPFKSKDIYQKLISSYNLSECDYGINQFRYDLRKLVAHHIIEKLPRSHFYQLSDYGIKVCLNFIIIRKQIYGPILNCHFNKLPNKQYPFNSKIEKAYYKIDKDFYNLYKQFAA